jgi:hypothetical protein
MERLEGGVGGSAPVKHGPVPRVDLPVGDEVRGRAIATQVSRPLIDLLSVVRLLPRPKCVHTFLSYASTQCSLESNEQRRNRHEKLSPSTEQGAW